MVNFSTKNIANQWIRIILILILFVSFMPMHLVNAEDAGWALEFDGIDDYVDLGKTEDVIGLGWKSTKSFSMWIKPLGTAETCYFEDVAYCDQILVNQPHFFGIARGILFGQDRIWLWNKSSTGVQKIGIQYIPNQWLHIAYEHDGETLKAYRNGILVGQIESGNTFTSDGVTSTSFLLGAFYKPEQQSAFQGLIDEVRIYSIVVGQQVISDTLRSTLNGNELGLRAYYQMSDGTGLTLSDNTTTSLWDGILKDGLESPNDVNYPQWVDSDCWDGPTANDQLVNVSEDTSLSINLTGTPVGATPLQFILDSNPSNGILSGSIPNFSYMPNSNFNGQDSFTFYVQEGDSQSNIATVFIDVIPVNDAPVAEDDSYSENSDSILTVNIATGVLSNDIDIDGDSLSTVLVDDVLHGVLVLDQNGSFTYTPDPAFHGTDQFTYKADDGDLQSDETVVDITVVQTIFPLYLPFIMK